MVLEVALVALILGALSLAPHSITAGEGVIPSYAQGIVAALAFITFLWQFVGILAIRRETTKLYHTYVRISTILTIAIIAVTIVFAILAAVHHSTAAATCVRNYGAMPSTTATGFSTSSLTQNYGPQICNYFLWAQTGVMFGLIVFLGLIQVSSSSSSPLIRSIDSLFNPTFPIPFFFCRSSCTCASHPVLTE